MGWDPTIIGKWKPMHFFFVLLMNCFRGFKFPSLYVFCEPFFQNRSENTTSSIFSGTTHRRRIKFAFVEVLVPSAFLGSQDSISSMLSRRINSYSSSDLEELLEIETRCRQMQIQKSKWM
ncbi:uncharacterized protein LOC120082552 [Benincasa hispida]|uniref:uncharacterized protein LOC120082552 n=1 Tax=Benincasa hispida TaxID=102211 RepID=UPI00190288CA|nr:uncharacterized protein LOC120082552 [Benincasa hispida]